MARVRGGRWTNWAGNQSATPSSFERPTNDSDVVAIVRSARSAGRTVKAVGTGHSFTPTALTTGHLVTMDRLRNLVAVDREAGTVTVGAGIGIGDLNETLGTPSSAW